MKPEVPVERSLARRIFVVIVLLASIVVPSVLRYIINRNITLDNVELIPTWLAPVSMLMLLALGVVLATIAAFLSRRWFRYGKVAVVFIYVFWYAGSVVVAFIVHHCKTVIP